MNRFVNGRRLSGLVAALISVTLISAVLTTGAVAGAVAGSTPRCGSFPDLVAAAHTQAGRRESTLTNLAAALHAREDPFVLNAGQISSLGVTNAAIQALDQKIATHCYGSRNGLLNDIAALFNQYRVYWLRVPQTEVVAAADYLGQARAHIHDAATKLAGKAATNSRARADLAAMNHALATADAKLGIAPIAAPAIAAVLGLQPAIDMTADTATINAARGNLIAARTALDAARIAGLRVVADLGG